MGYLKKKNTHTIPKNILKKKTINLNQRYKKEQKSREREREYSQFCVRKIWIKQENDIKFIQNKWVKEEANYKNK